MGVGVGVGVLVGVLVAVGVKVAVGVSDGVRVGVGVAVGVLVGPEGVLVKKAILVGCGVLVAKSWAFSSPITPVLI